MGASGELGDRPGLEPGGSPQETRALLHTEEVPGVLQPVTQPGRDAL